MKMGYLLTCITLRGSRVQHGYNNYNLIVNIGILSRYLVNANTNNSSLIICYVAIVMKRTMYILSPSPTARVGVVTVMPVLSLVACFLCMWQRKRVHTLRVGVTTRLWDLVRPVGIPGVLLLQVPCGVAGACGGVLRKNRPVHRQQARTLPLCPQVLPTQCAWIP